jgi:hypothetical protein
MNTNPVWQFPPLRSLSRTEVPGFLSERPFSAIEIGAAWDGSAARLAQKLTACLKVMSDVGFATIDLDSEQEYAKEVSLLNVPAVLYYRGTALVAQVIGLAQDVGANIEKLKSGEPIK